MLCRSAIATQWMVTVGPYNIADVFKGVSYDATQETTGWTAPHYAYTPQWQAATLFTDTWPVEETVLSSAMTFPLRRVESFSAGGFKDFGNGTYFYDFGK